MVANELSALVARDLTRLIQQLRAFPDDRSLWKVTPGIANSAGNLALHLEGNLREYIGRQLGGIDFTRHRPREFSEKGLGIDELVTRIEAVRDIIVPVIASLSATRMDAVYPENVLGSPLSTRQFLIHLQGHLNYHLGQIDYLRRVTTGDGAIALAGLDPVSTD